MPWPPTQSYYNTGSGSSYDGAYAPYVIPNAPYGPYAAPQPMVAQQPAPLPSTTSAPAPTAPAPAAAPAGMPVGTVPVAPVYPQAPQYQMGVVPVISYNTGVPVLPTPLPCGGYALGFGHNRCSTTPAPLFPLFSLTLTRISTPTCAAAT